MGKIFTQFQPILLLLRHVINFSEKKRVYAELFLLAAVLPAVLLAALGLVSALTDEGESLGDVLEAGDDGGEVFSVFLAAAAGAVAVFPLAEARVLGLEGFGLGSPEFLVSVTGVSWSLVMKVLWLRGGLAAAKNFSSMPEFHKESTAAAPCGALLRQAY